MSNLPLLSLLIWLPIVGGLLLLAVGERAPVRPLALLVSILTFLASLLLYTGFDATTAAMQFEERLSWIAAFNVFYHLGVDGISMPLIILTSFTTVLVVLAGWEVIKERMAQYLAAFLIMEGLMIGVFSALDAVLFYVFWEGMLIPMFLIIGMWGGPRRVYATIKFFLYTFLGSVFMLVALIYMYNKAGGLFRHSRFPPAAAGLTEQVLIFLAFLIAFAVKVPMWPVHTWLPDAHVEAPTGGSVILAAIMLKIGGYGFLRFSLPITPDASMELDWLIITMSLVAVVYISFVALVQEDMKKLIAYSSIAHMGFATLGFFLVFSILRNTGRAERRGHGDPGRHGADGLPRLHLRGPVPVRRRALRSPAQPPDRRLRRCRNIACPSSPASWCCSPWPMPACRVPRASSASSWSSWPASRPISGMPSWPPPP
jgi:NADH-quinone oxidoreductase subunit M